MRFYIAWTIHLAQSTANAKDRAPYQVFVQRLKPGDIVVTFNYDTLLESVLDESGVNYRHFFYTDENKSWADTSMESIWGESEIIILKMHGSIDWFDKTYYEYCKNHEGWLYPGSTCSLHPIFTLDKFAPRCLVGSGRSTDDPLLNVYRVNNLHDYFSNDGYLPHDIPLLWPRPTTSCFILIRY